MRCNLAVMALISVAVVQPKGVQAESYDMDCAVILCLAGGFPIGCGAAYGYMIRRITSLPPKPPFGFCAMGSLSDVDFPDNDDPAAFEAMMREIGDRDVIRSLSSVRAEIVRSYSWCSRGREDDEQYRCRNAIALDGDGGNFFMGTVEGWRRGKRVTFEDFEGTPRSLGDMEAYSQIDEACGLEPGEDGGWVCTPVFDWVPIATPVEAYEGG